MPSMSSTKQRTDRSFCRISAAVISVLQLEDAGADRRGQVDGQRALFGVPRAGGVVVFRVGALDSHAVVAAEEIDRQHAAAVRRAAAPHGDVRLVRGFEAERDPGIRKAGGAVMRVKIVLACTECKQRNYNTKKNKKNDPDRLEMNKYCRFCRKHTLHKETK